MNYTTDQDSQDNSDIVDRRNAVRIEPEEAACLALVYLNSDVSVPALISDVASGGVGLVIAKHELLHLQRPLVIEYQGNRLVGIIVNLRDVAEQLLRVGIMWCAEGSSEAQAVIDEREGTGSCIFVSEFKGSQVLLEQSGSNGTERIVISPKQLAQVIDQLAKPSAWITDSQTTIPGFGRSQIQVRTFATDRSFSITQGTTSMFGSGEIQSALIMDRSFSEITEALGLEISKNQIDLNESDVSDALADKRILIIDDDEFTSTIITRFLLKKGMTLVDSINDSREAVHATLQSKPDMMILDLSMPHLDGFGVLHQLREHDLLQDLKVIMLTAVDNAESKERALELGATAFVNKPISQSTLLKCIVDAFERDSSTHSQSVT